MFKIKKNDELKINKLNEKCNDICGYRSDDILRNLNIIKEKGEVLVGYRSSCGTTDKTHKIFSEWSKALKILEKNGIKIKTEPVKVGNSYATISGGFWNEYRYSLVRNDKFCSECGQTYNWDYHKVNCFTCSGLIKELK